MNKWKKKLKNKYKFKWLNKSVSITKMNYILSPHSGINELLNNYWKYFYEQMNHQIPLEKNKWMINEPISLNE